MRSFGVYPFVCEQTLTACYAPSAAAAHATLAAGNGPGGEMTAWLHLPSRFDPAQLARIEQAAARIRGESEVLVCIGIGGSYLGARALYELLDPQGVKLLFVGNGLSADALAEACAALEGRAFSVNVVSKSGTTTEPAIAFRIFRALLEARYGARAAERIYVTTDGQRGALHALAEAQGYVSFPIPAGAGGRYSVLSSVACCRCAQPGRISGR